MDIILSAAQLFSLNRCVPYKDNEKHCNSKAFRFKSFHNDAKNTRSPEGKKMCRRTITQLALNNKCKCSFFCNQV